MNSSEARDYLSRSSEIASQGIAMAVANSQMRAQSAVLQQNITALEAEVEADVKELELLGKAAVILANVSEDCTNQILNSITNVINKALTVLFPNDPKSIEITKTMYRDTHPHYNLVLKTQAGVARAFNQSGTGLAQVISFLLTACLIDARNGRKIIVMDELLNGLHPGAKTIVSDLMRALSGRSHDPFQFVCVEYGMDIGKQYEIKKGVLPNGLSVAETWSNPTNIGYYAALSAD